MRIVHVTNYQVPGYGYEEIMLARAQRRLNHEPIILTSNYLHPRGAYAVLRDRFPRRRVEPSDELVDGVRVIRLPGLEIGQRVWIRGLERQIRRLDPDVVHCHNLMQFHPMRMAWLKARSRVRFGLVVDDHMHFGFMRRSPLGKAAYLVFRRLVQPLLAREVDRYCAIGDDTKSYLETACGVRSRVDVRPLGVDMDAFTNSAERRVQARRSLGLQDGETVYVYTGKLIPAKGIHLLIQAALRLIEQGQRVRVLAVGDADHHYLDGLKRETEKGGREADFTFLPSRLQSDLPDVYAAADVAVWPRQESMAIYEALSMELPVIVSDQCGYLSMLGGLVRTYRHDDVASLAGAMRDLVDVPARRQLAGMARQVADQEFSWTRSAQRYLDTYNEALGRLSA
jgi:glycosyltransferase involved in cell wall biosynthesis